MWRVCSQLVPKANLTRPKPNLNPNFDPCPNPNHDIAYKSVNALSPRTWWMTANSSQPLTDDNFDCPMLLRVTFLEPAHIWVIDPSLLLWNNLLVHLQNSELTLWFSPLTENASVWLKTAVPNDWFLVLARFINVLTYLLSLTPT